MVEIEIDGRKVEVAEGSTVMVAAQQLGVYVPHFCYHKKLSIAANCRMCLVEVEKAPKPLPACATPVTAGMKVQTRSDKAVKAQQGVMEFLLINHPLDCPICDQGGECQLQDLAVGYGGSASRYTEEKRVVFHKSVGPLISAEEMSRCIHCTRCVRFGQEVAGVMELGMAGRGEHSEIMSFVSRGVHSELSGNMIDVCPVGALTSKPFRYSARTWELSRRRSVAAHDSLGSNIVVQVKGNTVMRVLPFENEAINECWLSDRDRFSYEGLNSTERLTTPMLRQDGQWREVDWPTAISYAAHALGSVRTDHGAAALGALATPQGTLEELHLLARLMRALGSENIDYRARVGDSRLAAALGGAPSMGMPIEAVSSLERIVVVGSFLRKDHPLLAARVRAAVKRGARLGVLHAALDDLLVSSSAQVRVAPSAWAGVLAAARVHILQARGEAVPADLAGVVPDAQAQALAAILLTPDAGSSEGTPAAAGQAGTATQTRKAIFLGNAVAHQVQALEIALQAQALADLTGATLGWLVEGANGTGGALAGALPGASGLDANAMVQSPRKAYLLMGLEPSLDHGQPAQAMAALRAAESVIALTAYRSADLLEVADCLLPIAPFSETSGSFVNAAGTLQTFNGVVRPLGESRPAWKVLRVLANHLGLPGFEQDSPEQVRAQAMPAQDGLSIRVQAASGAPASAGAAGGASHAIGSGSGAPAVSSEASSPANGALILERIADVPIHFADPVVRRAESLQATRDAAAPVARLNATMLTQLGVQAGSPVRLSQAGSEEILLKAVLDEGVADGAIRIAAAHATTAGLACLAGAIRVERA